MEKEARFEDDRDLVERCQKGDQTAFEELVHKYRQTVFNLVYHNVGNQNEVEDIAQKIFTKIYFSLPRFDKKRPLFPWLYRITINQCYDELRRLRRRKVFSFSDLTLQETDNIETFIGHVEPTAVSEGERKELHGLLIKLLQKLPEQQRTAIVLRDLEDLPYDKMAQIFKCSEQAVRLKVFRARARLRDLVGRALRRQERASSRTS